MLLVLIVLIVGGGEETVIIQYIEAELSWHLQGFSQHKPVDLKSFERSFFFSFNRLQKFVQNESIFGNGPAWAAHVARLQFSCIVNKFI